MPHRMPDRPQHPAHLRTVPRQRVRVPWRLVESAWYSDIALSVYVKVAALGARPQGCTAGTATIASYLSLSKASVERGMAQLRRPAPDGAVELVSQRRTLRGGRGTTALRRVREMAPREAFVWLPVGAAEDLTPRQLRAYAVIVHAQVSRIPLTERELAGFLRHATGRRAGQPLTAATAHVINALEEAGWVTVRRRAGANGRHEYLAHDFPLAPAREPQQPVTRAVGEASGTSADEGSLTTRERPRTDRPEDEARPVPPAVGEVRVSAAVDGPASPTASEPPAGSALPPYSRLPYCGPALTLSPRVHAVLEPVRWLLQQIESTWVLRRIAREIGRQLGDGMDDDRLRHRLTLRFAQVSPRDIRDPGRWLLGVALPRWGCGHGDCETGVMWSNGARCAVCAELVMNRHAARNDAGHPRETVCTPIADAAPATAAPPRRGTCGDCGCRILLVGGALKDGLCKPCRTERGWTSGGSSAEALQKVRDAYATGVARARSAMSPRNSGKGPG